MIDQSEAPVKKQPALSLGEFYSIHMDRFVQHGMALGAQMVICIGHGPVERVRGPGVGLHRS